MWKVDSDMVVVVECLIDGFLNGSVGVVDCVGKLNCKLYAG